MEWFNQSLDVFLLWLEGNPNYVVWVLFIVVFVESLVVIGVFSPGIAIMVTTSTLIASGTVSFWPVYLAAVLAGTLGDLVSFWLGRYFKDPIRNWQPIKKQQKMLQKGEYFFSHWGALSIAIGRFFGPLRAILPLIAGMMRMPIGLFMLVNVGSAIVWAAVYFVPGWLYEKM